MKGKRSAGKPARNAAMLVPVVFLLILAAQSTAEELKIGVGIANVQINQSQAVQLNLPTVNTITNVSPNITINIPVSYFETGLENVTIGKKSFGYQNPQNVKINESGAVKNATDSGEYLTWEANLSAGSATLAFDLLPPTVQLGNTATINATTIHNNFTVSSGESFTNVSITISVNASYPDWTLWLHNGVDFAEKTGVLHLNVSNGTATFHNLSTHAGAPAQLLQLRGSKACTESWSCTAWSDSANSCGTRTCTDSNSCGTTNSKPSESSACSAATSSGGGGGGGGGGGALKKANASADFEISDSLIRVELRGDGIVKKTFTIKNTGAKTLELKIDFSGVKDFAITPGGVSKLQIKLAPGDQDSFDVILFGSGLKSGGVYSGSIYISGGGITKTASLFIEYEPESPIFDIEVHVPESYSRVFPGEQVYGELRLLNMKGIGKVDVSLNYSARDSEGGIVASGHTTAAVETQASFVKKLRIPRTAKPGNYVFAVEVKYEGVVGVGSDAFEVIPIEEPEKDIFEKPRATPLALIAIFGIIAFIIAKLLIHARRRLKKDQSKQKSRTKEK